MTIKSRWLIVAFLLVPGFPLMVRAQQGIRSGVGVSPYPGVPAVPIPSDNPMTDEKAKLGKLLFFDPRLSRDGSVACATCHQPQLAFTDGRTVAVGINQQAGDRNTPTILNAAYNLNQFWDGRTRTLEEQALKPIGNPLEMGFSVEEAVARLNSIESYRTRFEKVFASEVTAASLAKAIAAFERTLVSGNAPFDRHNLGDIDALSEKAKLGIKIFRHRGRCSICHIGPTFTNNAFHNLGIGMDKPDPDLGRYQVTGIEKDIGAFKTPSLRNVADTAPYMHDGSLKTLEEVVDFYDEGGKENPHRDPRMFPRDLTDDEKEALVEFLRSLSGEYPQVESDARGGSGEKKPPSVASPASPSIDRLLGGDGRAVLERRLEEAVLDGTSYTWGRYAAWGKELFHEGQVQKPPLGPAPSPQISQYADYTCGRCHNVSREDPVLTRQDPEARFKWIMSESRTDLQMRQGTTLWGAVNRTTFYNGHFSIYHNLCVPDASHPNPEDLDCGPTFDQCHEGCRRMSTERIEDAVQVCARYCSVGEGYLAGWELNALLAYLWDLELHLSDLDLPPDVAVRAKQVLENPSEHPPREVEKYRTLLTSRYLTKSGETFRGMPESKGGQWLVPTIKSYRERRVFKGDPAPGKDLYALSCAGCHGEGRIGGPGGPRLVRSLRRLYEAVAEGTYQGKRRYMPEFTLQRLSHQQLADIVAYLESLGS